MRTTDDTRKHFAFRIPVCPSVSQKRSYKSSEWRTKYEKKNLTNKVDKNGNLQFIYALKFELLQIHFYQLRGSVHQ